MAKKSRNQNQMFNPFGLLSVALPCCAIGVLLVCGIPAAVAADPVDAPFVMPVPAALPAPRHAPQGQALIRYDSPQQVVDGFGFSDAWGSLPGSPANEDAFFSMTKGAGFSILRNRIPFRENPGQDDNFIGKADGHYTFTTATDAHGTYKNFDLHWDNWDLQATQQLIARVNSNPDDQLAKVFSTPWTTPNNAIDRWKHPTDPASRAKHRLTDASFATTPEVGGYLNRTHYQDYADVLADYVLGFKPHMGCDLYALSLQNEPGFDCDYESCDWNARQFHDFILVLNKEFTRKGVWAACPKLKIMAAEENNFRDALLGMIYADPATRNLVQIAAGHQYEYGPWSMGGKIANLFSDRDNYFPKSFSDSVTLSKKVWMSEWSTAAFSNASAIERGLIVARMVHEDFVLSHLNAFVYWWSQSLLSGGGPNKELWALAQYSRFVRPGWHVLWATPTPARGVHLTAFANETTGRMSIVIVNTSASEKVIVLNVTGGKGYGTAVLYRTSSSEDMAMIGSMPDGVSGRAVALAPSSISTFYTSVIR